MYIFFEQVGKQTFLLLSIVAEDGLENIVGLEVLRVGLERAESVDDVVVIEPVETTSVEVLSRIDAWAVELDLDQSLAWGQGVFDTCSLVVLVPDGACVCFPFVTPNVGVVDDDNCDVVVDGVVEPSLALIVCSTE